MPRGVLGHERDDVAYAAGELVGRPAADKRACRKPHRVVSGLVGFRRRITAVDRAGSVSAAPIVEREQVRSRHIVISRLWGLRPPSNDQVITAIHVVVDVLVVRPHFGNPCRCASVAVGVHVCAKRADLRRIALIVVKIEGVENGWALGLHRGERPGTAVGSERRINVRRASGQVMAIDPVAGLRGAMYECKVLCFGAGQPWPELFGSLWTSQLSTM